MQPGLISEVFVYMLCVAFAAVQFGWEAPPSCFFTAAFCTPNVDTNTWKNKSNTVIPSQVYTWAIYYQPRTEGCPCGSHGPHRVAPAKDEALKGRGLQRHTHTHHSTVHNFITANTCTATYMETMWSQWFLLDTPGIASDWRATPQNTI